MQKATLHATITEGNRMADKTTSIKKVKISEAEQHMYLMVSIAAILLGIAGALTVHFIQRISFNIEIISAEEESIASYSDVIKNMGICKSPKGDIYSDEELKNCDPDSIELSEIPNTLRTDILENLASNQALNSVPKEASSNCINPDSGKNYTYTELNKIYSNAVGSAELNRAIQLIKSCSALRVIPDALPAFKNEEALLASLNKLFIDSGWQPESLSPSGTSSISDFGVGLNSISVRLAVEADTSTTMSVLNNVERSIREFNIESATIGWSGNNTLSLSAQATAFYIDPTFIIETTKTLRAGDK